MSVHVAKHDTLRVLISRLLGQIVKKPSAYPACDTESLLQYADH